MTDLSPEHRRPEDPSPKASRLELTVEELSDILERMRALHGNLLDLLLEKERALVEIRLDKLEEIRDREEELLRLVIDEEKERLLLTEEVGDLLDHERPALIRVAEILPHISEERAVRLSGERERLREIALKLARQNAVNRALIEHSVGHVHVFLSKLVSEELGIPRYDGSGAVASGDSGSMLMDRRV